MKVFTYYMIKIIQKNIYFDTPKHKWKRRNKSGYIAGWVFIGFFIIYIIIIYVYIKFY